MRACWNCVAQAGQAGLSREYAGVSFERGDKDARAAGAKVGNNAWAKALTYFNGTAVPIPVPTTTTTSTSTTTTTTTLAPTTTEVPTTTEAPTTTDAPTITEAPTTTTEAPPTT